MTNVIHPYKSFASIPTKIRGLSVEVLLILYEFEDLNGLTCPEIAYLMDKKPRFIRVYLHRLYDYGLVEKTGDLWRLTKNGRAFVMRMRMKKLWRIQNEEQ